jgi:hypothetical protein
MPTRQADEVRRADGAPDLDRRAVAATIAQVATLNGLRCEDCSDVTTTATFAGDGLSFKYSFIRARSVSFAIWGIPTAIACSSAQGKVHMFTFGRAHELKCALAYVRNPTQAALVSAVINAVHDLIDGASTHEPVQDAITNAFVAGGSGVWEMAGSWLRKVAGHSPEVSVLWTTLARHESATVRFRAACFLNEMPAREFAALSPLLIDDKSKKVATMARSRTEEVAQRAAN